MLVLRKIILLFLACYLCHACAVTLNMDELEYLKCERIRHALIEKPADIKISELQIATRDHPSYRWYFEYTLGQTLAFIKKDMEAESELRRCLADIESTKPGSEKGKAEQRTIMYMASRDLSAILEKQKKIVEAKQILRSAAIRSKDDRRCWREYSAFLSRNGFYNESKAAWDAASKDMQIAPDIDLKPSWPGPDRAK